MRGGLENFRSFFKSGGVAFGFITGVGLISYCAYNSVYKGKSFFFFLTSTNTI